ncbi:MAG: hypothetical protein CME32_01245 [Gimesia sp.]|nr:hypothetical protein [Gimesia sp.]
MSEVVACGPSVTLDISETLHVKSAVVESTKHLNVSGEIPNPLQCPIARLFNGCFITQKYWSDDAAYPITLPTREGHHLIAVRLDKDEEVCISFKHLFAFSDQVNFQTVLDLSIASWAIDRAFQHLCKGPGLVVFECAGVPKVWDGVETESEHRIQVERMVLWPKDIQFVADKVHTSRDIYLGMTRMFVRQPSSGIPVILDVDDRDVTRQNLFSILKRLYRLW